MHGTLRAEAGVEDGALFFADLPDSGEAALIEPRLERSTYGAHGGPSWSTVLAILAVHLILLYGLVKFDVIPIAPKKKIIVVDLIAKPPAPPAEKPKPEPVVVEKIRPVVEVPPPVVQSLAPPPPPIQVTATPPPPKPVTTAVPPPSGPVMVGNLEERLIEGHAPRYPIESRRRKEQGTVVLRVLIGTDGRIEQMSVSQSSGFDRLDRAALEAARGWRWKPLLRDGEPVEIRGLLTFPFQIA